MPTSNLLFAVATFFAGISIYFFFRNERETKKLLATEDKLEHITIQEKSKLVSIIGSLADGIIVVDSTLKPWVINDSARKFLTITKEAPVLEDITKPFPPQIMLSDKIKEAISLNRVVSIHEAKIGEQAFQLFLTPLTEGQNHETKIIGVTILMQDVTHEKSIEKLKEDFSNMIVHELRAPITAVKDASGMMIKEETLNEEDKKNMLTLIYEQSNKLLNLVNTILDAARIEQNRLVLNKSITDIGKITKDQVDLFLPEAQRKKMTLIAEIGNNLPLISVDSVRITQVINNLLSNSLKYTNENGVIKLTVDTDEAFQKDKDSGNILISVSDNGIGIPKDKQGALFSKFGQIITSKTSVGAQKSSSGLGLFITKGIIEAHGGHVSLESEPGKGTTFSFTLPVSKETTEISAPINQEKAPVSPAPTAPMASRMGN